MKRQRVDGVDDIVEPKSASESKIAASEGVVGLPAELWARVFQYFYLDEIIECTAASRSFLNDVPRQLDTLYVRSGVSLGASPAFVERLGRVQYVHVHVIREVDNGVAKYHLDCVALENAVPFLSKLPNLTLCTIGKENDKLGSGHYDASEERMYDEPKSREKWASFISSICEGYKSGKLADHVGVDGLLPYNSGECIWKDIPKIDSYRDDVNCQICDMLCTSLPPNQVLATNDEFIPCISFKNMVKIVKCRDINHSQAIMTRALLKELEDEQHYCFMCPPDYVSRECTAIVYYDHHFERMKELILNGANPKDPTILKKILMSEMRMTHKSYCRRRLVGGKRIIELDSYNKLEELGLEMTTRSFMTVDNTDPRASITQFKARRVANQLKSGVAIGDIKDVQTSIKQMVNGRGHVFIGKRVVNVSDITLDDITESLEEWLNIDLSEYGKGIRSVVNEYRMLKK